MDYTARLNNIINKPGNKMCADCNGRNPRWASISLGVFVCIRCCGIHRALGTHISKMKSTTLDKWTPQMFHLFETVDNEISNAYWESRLPQGYNKPVESSGSYAVETFLRDKYERKQWIGTGPDPLTMATQPRQPDRPQMKIEKKEEKRTLSAGPLDADLLSDSAVNPHLRAHTTSHQPHLSTPDLHSHKVQENLTGLQGYGQHGNNPHFVQSTPAFNQNHLNLFPNGQAIKQVQNTPAANLSMPNFPQAPLVQGGNGVQSVPVAQTSNFTYNNPAYPQAVPQYATHNPYAPNAGYPGSNFPPQGFQGPSSSNFTGAMQGNPVNPVNSYNANIEAEKNMKINQVLSMYSSNPVPGQNTGTSGSTGFKPLGAIAAQNFFNQGAQSHPYPTF